MSHCKQCQRALTEMWRAKNLLRVALQKYRISPAEHAELLEKQHGGCAICGLVVKLCVDHNHKTGKVRGLLCPACNRGLGAFRDSTYALRAAVTYLEQD